MPLPTAAADHQTYNARVLAEALDPEVDNRADTQELLAPGTAFLQIVMTYGTKVAPAGGTTYPARITEVAALADPGPVG